jgi:replicative DNA helicase
MTKDIHYSLDLEAAILGACLLEREAFGRIYHTIEAENFYHWHHQIVFETLKGMYINGIPIDLFTVTDQIIRVQGRKQITPAFILKLTNHVVNSMHLEYHSYLIKTMWMERELIKLTTSGEIPGDTRQKIADIQEKLRRLQEQTTSHDWKDMTSLMVELYQHQEDMKASHGMGLTSGFRDIDEENVLRLARVPLWGQ